MATIVFVQDLAYDYFGVMHLSACLKAAGHQVEVRIDPLEKSPVESVLAAGPDLIAFSCLTATMPWAAAMARALRARSPVPIIFGGEHVTLNPADAAALPEVDLVCVGEGEEALVELAGALDQGRPATGIDNIWARAGGDFAPPRLRPLSQDLDRLPFADRPLYDRYPSLQYRPVKTILLGRGCPYDCNYCHNHAQRELLGGLGRYVRVRSVEHVLAEIDWLRGRYRFDTLHFVDDAFGNNRTQLLRLLPALKERGLRFMGSVRASVLDVDLVRAMKAGGVRHLGYAVETGDERLRIDVLKKKLTDRRLRDAARLLRYAGIPALTMNMVGLPGETLAQSLRTLALNIELRPVYAACYLYQPYPHTRLREIARERGVLPAGADSRLGFLSYDRSVLEQPDIARQRTVQRLFAFGVMFPRLAPLVRRACRGRPRRVYDLVFWSLYAYYLRRYFLLTPRLILHQARVWLAMRRRRRQPSR